LIKRKGNSIRGASQDRWAAFTLRQEGGRRGEVLVIIKNCYDALKEIENLNSLKNLKKKRKGGKKKTDLTSPG